MSRVSNIFRLQELDLELSRCHERIAEIDMQLADDEEVKTARSDLESKEEQLAEANLANSSADHAVGSQRTKIENTEKTLYGGSVTNPKELEDLQLESESLKRYLDTLEDRLLEVMVALEEAELKHDQASQKLTQLIARKSGENDLLNADRLDLLSTIERTEIEREPALSNISAEDLKTYEKFRQRFGGIALALIHEGSCGVCGVDLARSIEQDIRSGNTLVYCEQCGRILYAG
ncbi:MAG: C4-type zinc ribbon domain-containing protein [Anaerolineales bacterium]|nr:C4-type zinc ribbon domain-containing protein [Anaerolineales bacterium]